MLGAFALAALPTIRQAIVSHPTLRGDELELALYQLRRSTQGDITEAGGAVSEWAYFASFSSRTITHKGMVMSCILGPFCGPPRLEQRPPRRLSEALAPAATPNCPCNARSFKS